MPELLEHLMALLAGATWLQPEKQQHLAESHALQVVAVQLSLVGRHLPAPLLGFGLCGFCSFLVAGNLLLVIFSSHSIVPGFSSYCIQVALCQINSSTFVFMSAAIDLSGINFLEGGWPRV